MPDDPLDAIDPETRDYPTWEQRAETLLAEVIANDDENGGLANLAGDDLRDALRLAANRLRDLAARAVVPAPTYEAAVAERDRLRALLESAASPDIHGYNNDGPDSPCGKGACRGYYVKVGALAAHRALGEGAG